MSELSPAARELLAAARAQLGPDPAAIARMRSGIAATVGKGAAAGTGATLAVKLGLATVVAAVAIGAGVYVTRDSSEASTVGAPRERTTPALVVPLPIDVSSTPHAPAPIPAVEAAPPSPTLAPSPIELTARTAPVTAIDPAAHAAPPPVPAKPARPRAAADLAREVELIDHAMDALRAGKPTEALSAIRRHAVETRGRGQLAEDAAAIEIEAACQLHDPTVAEKLAAFDERYPTSAQRSRLTSDCR
ncbi:MAG TPA: hypothetical protein VM513_17405 [Kofleriaceae bacterium]|nr:hypothetical protein [Kofleriaceae bacterium]